MAIVYVPGSYSITNTSSTASFSSVTIGYNSVTFTATFSNASATNTHTWIIQGYPNISSEAGGFTQGTINRTRSYTLGEQVSGYVHIEKQGPNGGLLGSADFNFTTGYSYDDTPTPPPTPAPSFTDTTVAGGILGKSYSDGVSASTTTS